MVDPSNKRPDETLRRASLPKTPEHSPGQSQEQKLQGMLSALWKRSRHTVVERAALLEEAGKLLTENRLDEATRLRAVDSAHKLAGVLGTFGLPRGTELARDAEQVFGRPIPAAEMERLRLLLAELSRLIDRGP
jgi:HPt (histidine-containing phosphotransfer) domain-containing protein